MCQSRAQDFLIVNFDLRFGGADGLRVPCSVMRNGGTQEKIEDDEGGERGRKRGDGRGLERFETGFEG